MVKRTQPIRRQQPTNFLSVFDHFMGLALKGLRVFSKSCVWSFVLQDWTLKVFLQGVLQYIVLTVQGKNNKQMVVVVLLHHKQK